MIILQMSVGPITPGSLNDTMKVSVSGLAPSTGYDLFILDTLLTRHLAPSPANHHNLGEGALDGT
jgi:hypothetical protein